ncbi:Glycosyl transferase family 2 [Paenibacillus sophorae]|uniref:Glycosyl transferase family 2 n=1 Tax=Paenibacillus sophorae TaxID=1333845 RepID=A0A1H8TA29_9BACL|nr:glycosyltransferase [Paenibacillus sophorae]QWU17150.1 glycosyltransferase family 2 protein [Paenibacillus sophorae]SEO87353.1 Glycosyl transferase family 2 [Paenibacillus sophorae]
MFEHGNVPRLSIIICTYNRAGLLSKTLDSLLGLEMLDEAEVIVVDNRSTDDTAAVVKRFVDKYESMIHMKYLLEPVQGLSAARNAGILAAKSPLIAFLDDDALPVRTWISTIVNTLESRPLVMAMGGKVAPIFESGRPNWLIKPFEFPYTIMDLGNRIKEYPGKFHPCGANMAMRREVFNVSLFPLELGRKGDSLLSGEETWLFGKIRKEGQSVLYHPQMAVDHFVPASRLTEDWIMKRYYSQGLSNALGSSGQLGSLSLWGKTAAKVLYIAADSVLAAISRNEGRKLLNKCRLESVRGTLHMLRNRNRESATG